MATETLHCQVGGHKWTRTVKKGQKPRYCPEHSAGSLQASQEPSEPPAAPPPEVEDEEPREKTVRHPAEQKTQAETALASDRVGEEAKRKLSYCYERFEQGTGTGYLLNTYKMILREVQRRM